MNTRENLPSALFVLGCVDGAVLALLLLALGIVGGVVEKVKLFILSLELTRENKYITDHWA